MSRITGKRAFPMLALLAGAALLAPGQRPADRVQAALLYDKEDRMLFPKNYREWTFLSSGLGMTYGPAGAADAAGNPRFDNVFVNPTAYRSFLETGTWPDQTVLILEIRGSESKASINQGGHFQAQTVAVEAHVKDSTRGGWAFYAFPDGAAAGKIIARTATCYSCHEQNGAVDTTFVQFYPTLSDIAAKKGTLKSK